MWSRVVPERKLLWNIFIFLGLSKWKWSLLVVGFFFHLAKDLKTLIHFGLIILFIPHIGPLNNNKILKLFRKKTFYSKFDTTYLEENEGVANFFYQNHSKNNLLNSFWIFNQQILFTMWIYSSNKQHSIMIDSVFVHPDKYTFQIITLTRQQYTWFYLILDEVGYINIIKGVSYCAFYQINFNT